MRPDAADDISRDRAVYILDGKAGRDRPKVAGQGRVAAMLGHRLVGECGGGEDVGIGAGGAAAQGACDRQEAGGRVAHPNPRGCGTGPDLLGDDCAAGAHADIAARDDGRRVIADARDLSGAGHAQRQIRAIAAGDRLLAVLVETKGTGFGVLDHQRGHAAELGSCRGRLIAALHGDDAGARSRRIAQCGEMIVAACQGALEIGFDDALALIGLADIERVARSQRFGERIRAAHRLPAEDQGRGVSADAVALDGDTHGRSKACASVAREITLRIIGLRAGRGGVTGEPRLGVG